MNHCSYLIVPIHTFVAIAVTSERRLSLNDLSEKETTE
jgi:hypothetical protein